VRKLAFIFFLIICAAGTLAQDEPVADSLPTSSLNWNIQPQFGFIIPHRSEMLHLIQGHSRGINLQLLRETTGKKAWERNFQCPEVGLDVYFNYTGNADQLGNQFALSYLARLPLRKNSVVSGKEKYFQHTLGLGIGMGYNTKTWDLETNTQAQVIGSHLNAALTIEYLAQIFSLKKIALKGGLRLTHFSNGAFTLPNLGTNNISLVLTLSQKSQTPIKKIFLRDKIEKSNSFMIALTGGLKEIPPPYGKKYGSITMSAVGQRRLSYKSSLFLGSEVMFNSAVKTLRNRVSETPSGWEKNAQLSLVIGYGLNFDRLQLRILQGFYIVNSWQADGLYYQRVSLCYKITDHLQALIGLKTHFAKADHSEIGIGYIIHGK
jgi:hypothetical protein